MFYYLSLPFVSLLDFFDRGGPVIFILFLVAIIMITLLVERLIFFINDLKKLSADRVSEVQECPSDNKWIRNKIKLKTVYTKKFEKTISSTRCARKNGAKALTKCKIGNPF